VEIKKKSNKEANKNKIYFNNFIFMRLRTEGDELFVRY
jgi:hypothetical protein